MLVTFTIIATLLPLVYYLYVGLKRDSRPDSLEDYFIYGKKVTAKDFANTSVGYSLQMASLFLFVDWGLRYGFGAFWVPLFWGLGFALLYVLIPTFDRFLDNNCTLHGYLENVYQSRTLQVIAALATIIGLWGTMMVEVEYATSIYQPFFKSELSLILVGLLFLAFGFIYITFGGYKAEVNTERVQVPVAYAGLIFVLLALLFHVLHNGNFAHFWLLNILLFILFVGMFFAKTRISTKSIWTDKQILIPIAAVGIQVIITLLALFKTSTLAVSPSFHLPDSNTQLRAQGFLNLISLALANILWQIVDFSSWQRISSIDLKHEVNGSRYEPLRHGLWRVMIESPISWLFGVVLGMALGYSGFLSPGEDPSAAMGNFTASFISGTSIITYLGDYSWLIFVVFCASVVAIMMSTLTALISAITYTVFMDLPPFGGAGTLNKARIYAAAIVALGAAIYYALRHSLGVGIQSALYTFYSSQIALFPTIFVALFYKRINPLPAIVSLIVGIISTFFVASYVSKYYPDFGYIPPLITLIVSTSVYLIAFKLTNTAKFARQ